MVSTRGHLSCTPRSCRVGHSAGGAGRAPAQLLDLVRIGFTGRVARAGLAPRRDSRWPLCYRSVEIRIEAPDVCGFGDAGTASLQILQTTG